MAAVEMVVDSLKKSINLMFWVYYLLAAVLFFLAFSITIAVLAVPAIVIYFALGFQMISIILWAAIAVIGIILLLYINAVFGGIFLFLARSFLETGKLSIHEAFSSALPRANPLLLATVIVWVILGAIFVVLMLPVLLPLIALLSKISPAALLNPTAIISELFGVLLIGIIMFIIFFIIAFLLSPFTYLVAPVVVFENISAFAAVKKAFSVSKQNYAQNIIAIIFFTLVAIVIRIVFSIPDFLSEASKGLVYSSPSFFILLMVILRIASAIFTVIGSLFIATFLNVFVVNYYKFNCGESTLAPRLQPKTEEGFEPPMPSEKETKAIKLSPSMGKRI